MPVEPGATHASPAATEGAPATGRDEIFRAWERLAEAAGRLRRLPVDERIGALSAAAATWLGPESRWLRAAAARLAEVSPFSPRMLQTCLPSMVAPLSSQAALGRLLDGELGGRRRLEAFEGGRRAFPPDRVLLVLAGNLPGLAAVPSALALAIGAPVLVKCAQGDAVFPVLWRESIAAAAPALAEAIAVARWRGGHGAVEARLLREADLVVAWGSDEAVEAVARRTAGRFIGYGHRISCAYVAREVAQDPAARADAARALAVDVSRWDQRGCLSPHACFVEGSPAAARRFAGQLAAALQEVGASLPPARRSAAEAAAIRTWRERLPWENPGATVLAPERGVDWAVAVVPGGVLQPVPPARCLRVSDIPDVAELPRRVGPWRARLEACGLAAGPERLPALSASIARAGACWVPPLGTMQEPPLEWCAGGRPRIADWVRWAGTPAASGGRSAIPPRAGDD